MESQSFSLFFPTFAIWGYIHIMKRLRHQLERFRNPARYIYIYTLDHYYQIWDRFKHLSVGLCEFFEHSTCYKNEAADFLIFGIIASSCMRTDIESGCNWVKIITEDESFHTYSRDGPTAPAIVFTNH